MIYQSTPYNLTPVPSIQKFIEENLIDSRRDEELFEQSLRLEPRERCVAGKGGRGAAAHLTNCPPILQRGREDCPAAAGEWVPVRHRGHWSAFRLCTTILLTIQRIPLHSHRTVRRYGDGTVDCCNALLTGPWAASTRRAYQQGRVANRHCTLTRQRLHARPATTADPPLACLRRARQGYQIPFHTPSLFPLSLSPGARES